MDVRVFIYFFLNGITNSTCFFLLASGLNLIFGLLGILNFSHGSLFMIGAYLTYQFLLWTENFWLAVIVSPICVGLVGALIERYILRYTYKIDLKFQLLITFGLLLIIEDIIRLIWGVNWYTVNEPQCLRGTVRLLGWDYPLYNIFYTAVGFFTFLGLWLFLEKTRFGKKIVAAASNPELARGQGINISRLYTIVFAIGSWLAGLMGVFHGPLVNINLDMGHRYILTAFAVVVIGGLGNVKGTYLVSIILGQLEGFGILYVPYFQRIFMWTLMVLILLIKPTGLFGYRKT